MSSIDYYKYRLRCTTEDSFKYWILDDTESAPTTCPANSTHTIDSDSITIVKSFSKNIVKIQEELVDTGGNFTSTSIVVAVTGGTGSVTTVDQSWPFPISAMELQFATEETHRGDRIEMLVAPDTIIGALAANAATGATGITVSQTVIDYTMLGYYLELFDGVNTSSLGRVVSVDKVNNRITPENVPDKSFSAVSPTYVRQNIKMVHDYTFGSPQRYVVGESKIGGSYVPANTTIRANYYNVTGGDKCLTVHTEYLY